MKTTSFRRVIVPTDFTPCAARAIPIAAALARQASGELILLHVIVHDWTYIQPSQLAVYASLVDELRHTASAQLRAVDLASYTDLPVRRDVEEADSVAIGIATAARASSADLVVMGAHGRRLLGRMVLGGTTHAVLETSDCPVACVNVSAHDIVDHDGRPRIDRILVPTDFSASAEQAFQLGLELARENAASLDLLHVVELEPLPVTFGDGMSVPLDIFEGVREEGRKRLEAWAKRAAAAGVDVVSGVEEGRVHEGIVAHADETSADVIVMSRHGADGGRHRWSGMVDRILHDAHCAILTV